MRPRRYRILPVRGSDYASGVRYGIQVGGTGGRIIGEDLNLDRTAAERLAAELERAFDAGAESRVTA